MATQTAEQVSMEAIKAAKGMVEKPGAGELRVLQKAAKSAESRTVLTRLRENTPWGLQRDVPRQTSERNVTVESRPADYDTKSDDEKREIDGRIATQDDQRQLSARQLDGLNICVTEGAEGLDAVPDFLDAAKARSFGTLQGYGFLRETLSAMDDTQKEDFQRKFLSDPAFQTELNAVMQDLVKFDKVKERGERVTKRVDELRTAATAAGRAFDETAAKTQAEGEITEDQIEKEWRGRVDSAMETATVRFVNKRLDGVEQELKENGSQLDGELNVKARKEGKTTVGRVAENLRARWNDKSSGKNNVNADWSKILEAGGPSALLKELKTQGVINDDELELIQNDEKLMKDFEAYTVKTLIAKRSRRGGKFSKLDIENLADAQWCGEEKFVEIMQSSTQFEQFIKGLEDQGKVQRGWLQEIARLPKSKFAMIMAILFGLAALPVGVGVAALGGIGMTGVGIGAGGTLAGGIGAEIALAGHNNS